MIVITKNITAESETIIEISKPIIIYVEVENTENLITNIKLKISENAGDVILMFVGVDPRNLMDDNDKYDFDDGEVIEYKPSYCFVTLKVTESV
jgi:hypothetical protein